MSMTNYYMPTKIVGGENCIVENRSLFKNLGKKALIVTGRTSAKKSGAGGDVVQALEANGQGYTLFDQVVANPAPACAFDAADAARREACDFVIAVGGGSPMDLGKAAAAVAVNPVSAGSLFTTPFDKALPVIAVPTTAGTGSEVTQYAVLTNDAVQSKSSLSSPALFPRIAFLDARYLLTLSRNTLINTALDALSHAVEGILGVRASFFTSAAAKRGVRAFAECLPALKTGGLEDPAVREKLLFSAALDGMVIANTGTLAVHAMGYFLTYFKNVDHGRANALLLGAYLRFVQKKEKAAGENRVGGILGALGMESLDEFDAAIDELLGVRERCTAAEIEDYAERAVHAKHIANGVIKPDKADLREILTQSLCG
ncbi:MAG: iron-containing alcohol dehydrogenase [Spirochaetaceae bacterium]|jgi:alcohol dehydrogenase class IV|nr:iron-containing alcohol dehydrogenase [Spirochaetaceae bacterium]